VFYGPSSISIDAKGRISIPVRHRDALSQQCGGRVTLTRNPDGCLLLFPRPVWEILRERIAGWPLSAKAWQRIFLGSALDVEMDSAGRILISPELRSAAGLTQEVMLQGMGSHFEIWDPGRLAENEAKAKENGVPEEVSKFSFRV
jgi:MraZ protein